MGAGKKGHSKTRLAKPRWHPLKDYAFDCMQRSNSALVVGLDGGLVSMSEACTGLERQNKYYFTVGSPKGS